MKRLTVWVLLLIAWLWLLAVTFDWTGFWAVRTGYDELPRTVEWCAAMFQVNILILALAIRGERRE